MDFIKFEKQDNIGLLKISKPKALNALSSQVLRELHTRLNQIKEDGELRVLVLTGDGDKAFVAGADIKEIHSLDSKSASEFAGFGQKVFMQLEDLDIPVIAAINGFALGGGLELALACDFIFASTEAKMGLPECTLGLMPGFGGSVRLARRIGPGRAKELTFTGAMFKAEEAFEMGLVNRVFFPEGLMEETLKVARTMAKRAPLALAAIKKIVDSTYGVATEKAMQMEQQAFAQLFNSEDCSEGTLAFIEKRKPQFKGK